MTKSVTLTFQGSLLNGSFGTQLRNSLIRTAKKLTKIGEIAAKQDMEKKRKHPTTESSPLIASFVVESPVTTETKISGVVFAGGPGSQAFYADWVNRGHNLRNKKGKFTGYQFMDAGAKKASAESVRVAVAEISKIR